MYTELMEVIKKGPISEMEKEDHMTENADEQWSEN